MMTVVTEDTRARARAQIRQWIIDLEVQGITLYKISLMCHRQFNTVKNWKLTGRIEKCDGDMLQAMHSHYCKDLTT